MDSSTTADYAWLLSAAATPLLRRTQADFMERANPVRIAKTLRKQTSVTRSALIMDQSQLRIRARVKFSRSDEMFFTRRGLEQSTSEDLARYKASRFNEMASLADVCCGIGGDLVSLIHRPNGQSTVGVDSDTITTLFARHNAEMVNTDRQQHVQVQLGEFADFDFSEFEGVHCDPDRRVGKRTIVGSRFSPPLEDVFHQVGVNNNLAVKVAPATAISESIPPMIEREWLGDRRECKQQIIWYGPRFDRPGNRTATFVDGHEIHQFSVAEEDLDVTIDITNRLRKYLYEPHPTVLAAGLNNALARECEVARLAIDVEYLTENKPIDHPLLTRFEIVAAFPLDLRRTVEFLKKREVGTVEIKKRGVGKTLFDQFERMKIEGPYRATVILTRIGAQRLVAIGRRKPTDFPA